MATQQVQKLFGVATQGGADAFVSAAIQTALAGLTKIAYKIEQIEIEIPRTNTAVTAANFEVAITRRAKTSMPLITDIDVIKKWQKNSSFATSGLVWEDGILVWRPDGDVLIVEDNLYLNFDSAAMALTQSCYCAISYTQQSISEIDRLSLLTQSLQ